MKRIASRLALGSVLCGVGCSAPPVDVEETATNVQALTCFAAARVERISVATDGTQANALSFGNGLVSRDGQVLAFLSDASNIVSNDTNDLRDAFVRDRGARTTARVSVASDGTQIPGQIMHRPVSTPTAISGNGRFVVFVSTGATLVPGDTNDTADIFVHDRVTHETSRVSVASDGSQGNLPADLADRGNTNGISDDGRFVAFASRASNLVPGDTNGGSRVDIGDDVFVHDRATGLTTRVSVDSNGGQANGESGVVESVAMSGDGRIVAFVSTASNLVPGDTNGASDVFVHDMSTGATTRVSVDSNGAEANALSFEPAISSDGRFVAFTSFASNLVPGDTNGFLDLFVHDRVTHQTTRASVASDGTQAIGGPSTESDRPRFSSDGRFLVFLSTATNLVAGDTNDRSDAFVRDRVAGTTTRVSLAGDGSQLPEGIGPDGPGINADGSVISFTSTSPLVADDTNGVLDLYVRQLGSALPPSWTTGVFYAIGARVSFDGKVFRARQAHTSQVGWDPPSVFALWEMLPFCGDSAWLGQVSYAVGDVVTFNGHSFRCLQAHMSQPDWTPPLTPALWQDLG